jgi:hypothetical protein
MKVSNEATDSNGSNFSNNNNNTISNTNNITFATISDSAVNVCTESNVLQQRENNDDKVNEETTNDIPNLHDRGSLKESIRIHKHDLILVTDLKWYEETKPDNIGLSCEHKFTTKDFVCCKAYYHCKTCTEVNTPLSK